MAVRTFMHHSPGTGSTDASGGPRGRPRPRFILGRPRRRCQNTHSVSRCNFGAVLTLASVEAGTVRLWDLDTGKEVRSFPLGNSRWTLSLRFSPDGTLLTGVGNVGAVWVYDLKTGKQLLELKQGGLAVQSVLLAGDSL